MMQKYDFQFYLLLYILQAIQPVLQINTKIAHIL